ncbi:MAG TPA: M14 family metallopeptidase [Pirellulales bacterium]|jgi:hypothetical protein|nr:M14 family metallopeptidase [Pirellulales bacterium]
MKKLGSVLMAPAWALAFAVVFSGAAPNHGATAPGSDAAAAGASASTANSANASNPAAPAANAPRANGGAPSIYQPQGAPADPKVPMTWNRYRDHAEISAVLKELVKAFPKLAKLQSLGKSYGGREMWVLTITNFERGPDTAKPAMWIDGGIHANEVQAVEVTVYTAWYLLEMYGRVPFITQLVDERTFYIMPMMSPDSRDAHMHEPNTTHSPRTGQRPFINEEGEWTAQPGERDLDADGNITQMRIKDPNGRYKPNPEYPNQMVRAEPGELGEYTLLGQENFENDADSKINGAYDPNRNWPWNWQPKYVQRGAHHYPFSLLEDRLVGDFIMAHPNIAGGQSFHNTGGVILHGPGANDDNWDRQDLAIYDTIGKKGEQILPGYRSINIAKDLYEVYGGEIDWLHQMQGVFTFTNELFTPFNFFRKPADGAIMGRQEELNQFNRWLLFGEGIVPWHEIEHPQFGKIEVGGLKKNWVRQPPSFLLEEECHRNMAFALYHADQMPQVQVQSIKVRALAGAVNEVTAVVVNHKIIPDHSVADLRHKVSGPDLIQLSGPNVKVLAGLHSEDQFFQDNPIEQPRQPAELKIDRIGSMGVVYCRWYVTGNGPYTVRIHSPKGGNDALTK